MYAAVIAGTDRIELCYDLSCGGVSPHHADIDEAGTLKGLPVNVLIRPRGGDFVYDEKEIEKTMETLPQFQKATEYIGAGTLGEFAFEGAANGFVKESIADIQKNLLEVKQAEKQAQLEKQAEKQLENPVKEEPKLEAPKMGGLQ